MSADEILGGRTAVAVPAAKQSELLRRLAAAGYEHNQTDPEFLRAVPADAAPHVVAVLDAWLDEVGLHAFGPELTELRKALAAETRQSSGQ